MMTRTAKRTGSGTLAGLALLVLTFAAVPTPSRAAVGVTDDNVVEKTASASTAADHQALATYFSDRATEAGDKVKRHQDMLARMKGHGKHTKNFLPHCNSLIRSARQTQDAYENLAKLHLEMAKETGN